MFAQEPPIPIDRERIATFCREWRIIEFALFGSVLRDDFRSDSDVDILVTFSPDSHSSLIDLIEMTEELQTLLGREAGLLEKQGIRNPFRRRAVLRTKEVVYAARRIGRSLPLGYCGRGAGLGRVIRS